MENSNWDILDAMIYLEKNGKTRESQRAEYSTKTERCVGEVIDDGKEERRSNFKDSSIGSPNGAVIFWTWAIPTALCRERRQGNIQNPNHCTGIASALRILGSTPIAYHWIIPEYAISFSGTGHACSRSDINKAMDSAAETAENIKTDSVRQYLRTRSK